MNTSYVITIFAYTASPQLTAHCLAIRLNMFSGYLLNNLHKVFQKTLVKTYLTELLLCGDLTADGGLQIGRAVRHQAAIASVAQEHGPYVRLG